MQIILNWLISRLIDFNLLDMYDVRDCNDRFIYVNMDLSKIKREDYKC